MKPIHFSQYQGVIFDMDGVLIDSEPLWKIAMDDVFSSLGSTLKKSDFQQTVGLRIDQVVTYWNHRENWGIQNETAVVNLIIDRMCALVAEHPYPLIGVIETLTFLNDSPVKIGLATSSPQRLIDAVLDSLNIRTYFDAVHSAELEHYGKPHPAVYLQTAASLGLYPNTCLVIEDSLNGVIAGKAAMMQVVCIPEKTHIPNPKLVLADFHYDNMALFLDDIRKEN
jgi:sugar-phosphatase